MRKVCDIIVDWAHGNFQILSEGTGDFSDEDNEKILKKLQAILSVFFFDFSNGKQNAAGAPQEYDSLLIDEFEENILCNDVMSVKGFLCLDMLPKNVVEDELLPDSKMAPLLFAINLGHTEIVKVLLDAGASLTAKDRFQGENSKNKDLVRKLFEKRSGYVRMKTGGERNTWLIRNMRDIFISLNSEERYPTIADSAKKQGCITDYRTVEGKIEIVYPEHCVVTQENTLPKSPLYSDDLEDLSFIIAGLQSRQSWIEDDNGDLPVAELTDATVSLLDLGLGRVHSA